MKATWMVSLVLMVGLSFGFRPIAKKNPWGLTENDPFLYIKLCPAADAHSFDTINIPEDDPFGASQMTTVRELTQTVIQDYEQISSSYLKFEIIPLEGEALPENATYTPERAADRTIEICLYRHNVGAGTLAWKGDRSHACLVEIGGNHTEDTKFFTQILTHELGHCLGLNHAHDTEESVISYFARLGIYRLMMDDRMAITYLYPAKGSSKFHQSLGLSCDVSS